MDLHSEDEADICSIKLSPFILLTFNFAVLQWCVLYQWIPFVPGIVWRIYRGDVHLLSLCLPEQCHTFSTNTGNEAYVFFWSFIVQLNLAQIWRKSRWNSEMIMCYLVARIWVGVEILHSLNCHRNMFRKNTVSKGFNCLKTYYNVKIVCKKVKQLLSDGKNSKTAIFA